MAPNSLVQFESSAAPAVINYNVPEGVFYSGRHYLELPLLENFGARFLRRPPSS